MATLYQSLLRRLTGWKKRIMARGGHGQLPKFMQAYLAKQFKLLPENMADLRYVRRSNDFVRVYDTTQAHVQGVIVRQYHDLDKHPELVRFYGRLGRNRVRHLKKNVKW